MYGFQTFTFQEKSKEEHEAELVPRVSTAMKLGLSVIETAFEKLDVEVINSDTEDEDADTPYKSEAILEPKVIFFVKLFAVSMLDNTVFPNEVKISLDSRSCKLKTFTRPKEISPDSRWSMADSQLVRPKKRPKNKTD